jgi:hypothetical protein
MDNGCSAVLVFYGEKRIRYGNTSPIEHIGVMTGIREKNFGCMFHGAMIEE